MEQTIKVLIADDDRECVDDLFSLLGELQNVRVVGIAMDGVEAYQEVKVKSPNIVLLDLFIPSLDGIALMERIRDEMADAAPKFIIVSSIVQDSIVEDAFQSGAGYFMTKPLGVATLKRAIEYVLNKPVEAENINVDKVYGISRKPVWGIEKSAGGLLAEIGLKSTMKGFQYLVSAITIVVQDVEKINAITNDLYRDVAIKHATTYTRVERTIRYAIDIIWFRGDQKAIEILFGYNNKSHAGRPSNSEVIAVLSDKVRMNLIVRKKRR